MADMFNHSPTQMMVQKYNPKEEGFVFTASVDIKKGQEITMSYGKSLSNYELFHTYGFI